MNLEPTDEQRALRATVRQFLAEHAGVDAHVRQLIDDDRGTTSQVWNGLANLGATGVLVPAEHGGAGMAIVDAAIVAEEMGAGLYPGPWLSSAVAAPRAIARFGAGSEAAELLAGIAAGDRVAAVGPLFSVPATSSGNGRVSGEFVVDDARAADIILTVTQHGEGLALYAVETALPEVTLGRLPGIDQTHRRFQVTLDHAPGRLLGTAGAQALSALVDDVLIVAAADALGAAQRLVDMTVDYAKTRTQFGQAIGSFQSVAHLCVDMFENVELARSGVIHAAWAADEGDGDHRHLAALRLKAFSGQLAAVGDTAIQVFGGVGYTWEHDAHLYLKRLLSFSTQGGNADRYLELIGSEFAAAVTAGQPQAT
ncbi:acyl-CoA dehydrogenase family protein [Mycolicibacterium pyrenivorans]|uniref:acyl-CoA dehydrogenase family protein n=1 Tax=Mycolicibacterium pyrenivorans TaxID=187102 RepID=UPI0021F35258|nr:acyl-CoA dehydrogenase family protein [Mycolicibacterium pyrenivorans]MCV7151694.1 acyl-CoA/acyl-ACP dehydrogenase [Mycolicibacterium pyrenivorans]